MKRPTVLGNYDLHDLIAICEEYLDEVENGDEDTDTKHYIFESVMSTLYGENVWDWINNQDKEDNN